MALETGCCWQDLLQGPSWCLVAFTAQRMGGCDNPALAVRQKGGVESDMGSTIILK